MVVRTPELLKADDWKFRYELKTNTDSSNLDLMSYGTYRLAAHCCSGFLYNHHEEAIVFAMSDGIEIVFDDGSSYELSYYDTLYIPIQTPYKLLNHSDKDSMLIVCKAAAENKHDVYYSNWKAMSVDKKRIRKLRGKDVFLMFDVTEKADKLIAGYTIYEPHTRAWPAHNHSDQEEVYIFTKGKGAMEVYSDEEHKTFVTSLNELDAVSIPILNYHPVFSQGDELHFIWCIAGERYWVGDKNKDFMEGKKALLST